MNIYVENKPENCNHCIFKQDISRYLDLDDYCAKSKMKISMISMDMDCPLGKLEEKDT